MSNKRLSVLKELVSLLAFALGVMAMVSSSVTLVVAPVMFAASGNFAALADTLLAGFGLLVVGVALVALAIRT
jgi:hypothetical protein